LSNDTIQHYHQNAKEFVAQYDSMDAQKVHGLWLNQLAQSSIGNALDIGAGSGRDARWMASLGWQVTAVEPAEALRRAAQSIEARQGAESAIVWLDDQLPSLARVRAETTTFDLILLSAVWMHVEPQSRPAALKVLFSLLAETGLMVMTLRFGPDDPLRPMFPVSADEVQALAAPLGVSVEVLSGAALEKDQLNRAEVHWQTLLLRHTTVEGNL
jgi:protein-L-isoaspartate O-methyltransferase